MAKIKITEKPLVQNPPEDYNLLVSYDIDDMESLRRIPVSALKGDLEDEIDDVRGALAEIETGLSAEAKAALLACFAHVAWIDEGGQDYYDALEEALSVDPPVPPVSPLIYSWDFTQSLVDSISSKTAQLTASNGVSNPVRNSNGVVFSGAGQALMLFDENTSITYFANKTIQIDVASFVPNNANNNFHVRFLMYNRPTIGWDSGVVFRQAASPNLGWSVYGNGGWGSASAWGPLTNRTDISGHTVSIYIDENLVPTLYIDSVLKGKQTIDFHNTGVGLMIGNINPNPAAQGGTFYAATVTGVRIYNGEVA